MLFVKERSQILPAYTAMREGGVHTMNDIRALHELPLGRTATITSLTAPEAERFRLLSLGFIPGSSIRSVLESPWGDPVAYEICGAVIALRRTDARNILIQTI